MKGRKWKGESGSEVQKGKDGNGRSGRAGVEGRKWNETEAEVEGRKWKGGRSERAEVEGRKWSDGSGRGRAEVKRRKK